MFRQLKIASFCAAKITSIWETEVLMMIRAEYILETIFFFLWLILGEWVVYMLGIPVLYYGALILGIFIALFFLFLPKKDFSMRQGDMHKIYKHLSRQKRILYGICAFVCLFGSLALFAIATVYFFGT